MKIGVFGVGYVGLVSGACFSAFGHKVVCIDNDTTKIERLRRGSIPIYEPGLKQLVDLNVSAGRLSFETSFGDFLADFNVIFITVGTPSRRGGGDADLTSLYSLIESIKHRVNEEQFVVIKSTVPIGTNKAISKILKNENKYLPRVISNPEFLREGSAIEDFMKPDRVIVGLKGKKAKKVMAEVYKPLYLREFPIIYTDPESAEAIKYASNAFLAAKVTFINEVAHLCEKVGADIKQVARGMGMDGRIGTKFLHAGPGYGGSCFPKDTLAFTKMGKDFNARQTIIEKVIEVNNSVKERMVEKIFKACSGKVSEKIICVFGVTFKPNTDDMREAPSLTIIPKLLEKRAKVRVVDPKGTIEGKALLKNVSWFDDCYEAAKGADLIVILTEWNEFRALDLERLSFNMRNPILVDLRNIYSRKEAVKGGFKKYTGIGRQ